MKPSFFLLGPLWLLILNSLFLASGLASSWSPCLFDTLGPCPWLGLDPPPLSLGHFGVGWSPFMKSKSRSSSVINVQREPRKKAFTYSRMGPVASGSSTCRTTTGQEPNPPFCLKLVLKIDLIALHASRSLRLLVRGSWLGLERV